LLVWLFLGTSGLAGAALVLHRLDKRHGNDLLRFYLQSLIILDIWRGTLFSLTQGFVDGRPVLTLGGVDLTTRLVSPAILLGVLAVYLAGGTQPATRLIFRILALGAVWGVLVPGVLGVAGLLGWVALPGEAADLLLGGTGARLVETLALAAGVLAAIVSWQFIVNRRWNLQARVAGLLALMAGMIGVLLFVATFTLEGWLRPGYKPLAMYVSALSLGPRGWIQVANFIIFGVLLFVFTRGVAAEFPNGKVARSGLILLTIIALCYLLSGPFVMDATGTSISQTTVHGLIHGILGAVAGIIGVFQANEALKEILGIGESMVGRFLDFNALDLSFHIFEVRKNPDCPLCGETPVIKELIQYSQSCISEAAGNIQCGVL